MDPVLSTTDLLKLQWEVASSDERLVLLVDAYEAFAQKAACAMRKKFSLPSYRAYRDLLRIPKDKQGKTRLSRTKTRFRKVVTLLDRKGIFYRDYLAVAFRTWRTPRQSQCHYRLGRKLPAAFPLPQHLIDDRIVNQYFLDLRVKRATMDPHLARTKAICDGEWLVGSFIERNPTRYPTPRSVLEDSAALGMLPGSYLEQSELFAELVASGFYRDRYGDGVSRRMLQILTGTPVKTLPASSSK